MFPALAKTSRARSESSGENASIVEVIPGILPKSKTMNVFQYTQRVPALRPER